VNNIKAGRCEDCGSYWTVTGGGLNDDGQCPECEKRLPVEHTEPVYREPDSVDAQADAIHV